jgi:hypothetical protein
MPCHPARARELVRAGKAKRLSLAGLRFGRLLVIEPAPNQKQWTCWVCRCDCGNDCVVKTYYLKRGSTKSCGCWRTELRHRFKTHGLTCNGEMTREYHMFHSAKKRAKQDGCPFNLELTDIVIPERCPVFPEMVLACGIGKVQPCSPTLDKLVPEFGYVKGNVRVISHKANSIKQSATADELLRVSQWLRGELLQC